MPPAPESPPDMAQLLEDVRHVNALARAEAERLDERLRRRVEETWMPGPAADALIAEISEALGALAARVKLAEDGVRELRREVERRQHANCARSLPAGTTVIPCDRFAADENLYPVETSPDGVSFRWTGANPRIELAVEVARPRPVSLEIVLFALIRPAYGRQLTLSVDGQPVTHHFAREGLVFVVRAPLPASPKPQTSIAIELPATHSPAELGRNPDKRQLGVAIAELRFAPMSGLLARVLRRLRPGA